MHSRDATLCHVRNSPAERDRGARIVEQVALKKLVVEMPAGLRKFQSKGELVVTR